MAYTVLVIGGYGVFGGRLVRLLQHTPAIRVLVAGRSRRAAERFCKAHGGEPFVFDRNGDLAAQLAAAEANAVVDATGPFQNYGRNPYRLPRAVLAAGAHYLDLADDAAFVAGIGSLDAEARRAGCTALSGVGSVPAISSAAVERLRRGMVRIEHIDTVILPGNRSPRGRSLVCAIAAQVGRPLKLWRGGVWTRVPAWSGHGRWQLSATGHDLGERDASLIGAPDLQLFPARYGARTVLFRAGLALGALHLGLAGLGWLPRLGLLRSLQPLAPALRALAVLLRPWGDDRDGMAVTVIGENAMHYNEKRVWTLIAEAGDGPGIAAVPAYCWLHYRALGVEPTPGARPCLGELSLEQLAHGFAQLAVSSEQLFSPAATLFERALGREWPLLPAPLRLLHGAQGSAEYHGVTLVENGSNLLARLLRVLWRLPPTTPSVPLRLRLQASPLREQWQRYLGGRCLASVLQWDAERQRIVERFGLLRLELGLARHDEALHWPVTRGWLLGVPLPRWLLPISTSLETVDAEGRFCFDVHIRLPGIGLIARYAGWLAAGKP